MEDEDNDIAKAKRNMKINKTKDLISNESDELDKSDIGNLDFDFFEKDFFSDDENQEGGENEKGDHKKNLDSKNKEGKDTDNPTNILNVNDEIRKNTKHKDVVLAEEHNLEDKEELDDDDDDNDVDDVETDENSFEDEDSIDEEDNSFNDSASLDTIQEAPLKDENHLGLKFIPCKIKYKYCLESNGQLRLGPVQEAFINAKKHFGLKFTSVDMKMKPGLDSVVPSLKHLKLNVNLDLEDTWLKHPTGTTMDPIGLWDKKELEFKGKNYWVPEAHHKELPKRIPCKIMDTDGELFFNKKRLLTPTGNINLTTHGNIDLTTTVFSKKKLNLPNKDMHKFEELGRQGVLDAEITHSMLDLNQDIVVSLSQLFNTLDLGSQDVKTVNDINENLQNLLNFNKLAMQSNYRTKTFAIQTCVKAKSDMRSKVLRNYHENDAGTKEKLMCSSFFTNSLFGPLPKTLTEIQPNSSGSIGLLTLEPKQSRRKPLNAKSNFTKKKPRFIKRKPETVNSQSKRGKFDANRVNKNSYRGKNQRKINKSYAIKHASYSPFPNAYQQNSGQSWEYYPNSYY